MGENIKQLYSSLIDQSDRQVNNGITKFDESQGRKILDNNTVTYTSVLEDCIKNKQGKINTKLIPNKYEIMSESNFGKISKNHSFTSDASFERILIFILKGNFLGFNDESNLLSTHELFAHLKKMLVWSKNVDFSDVKGHIHNYARQENIDTNRMKKFLAAMLHYDLDVSTLIRFLGGNYTGEYRNVSKTINILRKSNCDEKIITDLGKILMKGCPNKFVTHTSHKNLMRFFKYGNHKSIQENLKKTMKTMNKEDRNQFLIPLPN